MTAAAATMPPPFALDPIRLQEPPPPSAPTRAVALLSQDVQVAHIVAHVAKVREVVRAIFKPGVHFGVMPGTEKKCPQCGKFRSLSYRLDSVVCEGLDSSGRRCGATFDMDDPRVKVKKAIRKEGGEALCLAFHLAPEYMILRELRDPNPPHHLELVVQCFLRHAGTGAILGMAIAAASTRETKWGLIQGQKECPECQQQAIRRSTFKNDDGSEPGWYCNEKLGGCNAKFDFADTRITGQAVGKGWREEMADVHNTIWAMACKRAMCRAVVQVTACGDAFDQEPEDEVAEHGHDEDRREDRADRRAAPPPASHSRSRGPAAGAPTAKVDTGKGPKRDAAAEKKAAADAKFGAEALAEAFKRQDWADYNAGVDPEPALSWAELARKNPVVLREITDAERAARGAPADGNATGWTVTALRALRALSMFNPAALKAQTAAEAQPIEQPASADVGTAAEAPVADSQPEGAEQIPQDSRGLRAAIEEEWKRLRLDPPAGMAILRDDLGMRVMSLGPLDDEKLIRALRHLRELGKGKQ